MEPIDLGRRERSDDVLFIPLAVLEDSSLVPKAISTALGIREEPGR